MVLPEQVSNRTTDGSFAAARANRSCSTLAPPTARIAFSPAAPGAFHHRLHDPDRAVRRPVHVRFRPGKVVEASLIGGALTLAATFVGGWSRASDLGHFFNLSDAQVTIAMAIYGFIAAVLPVWMLLTPRDYLSSFLKIGTIALLVVGTIIANPKLAGPGVQPHSSPAAAPIGSRRPIFPFLFITIMCGAISGFQPWSAAAPRPK